MTISLPVDRERIALLVFKVLAFSALWLAALCLLATPPAFAAKDHCRDISFDGVAGAGSQDVVSFIVQGCDGNPVHESCPIQVQSSEDSVDFLKRLPGSWGEPDFSICPTPDPNDLPKKVCVNSNNGTSCNPSTGEGCHSCKLKLKLKQKSDGTYKKKHVQVCCYENADCKKKLGKIDAAPIPVTIQAEKNFTDVCPPDEEACAESPSSCTVNLDPMGMQQFPGEGAKKCRILLGKEASLLARTTIDSMVRCHAERLKKGSASIPFDCNDPSTDFGGAVSAAEGRLASKIAGCSEIGSPWRLGYRSCHAPCDTIDILTCTAGANIGSPCTADRDCDTAPGARDGKCGDWSRVAACMACEAEAAAAQVVADKFGTPNDTMSKEAADCQNAIGRALSSLVRAHLSETSSCQKKRDAAKLVLPSGAPSCKEEDIKGKRAKAESVAAAEIQKGCAAALLAELDSICSGAATVTDVAACVLANGRTMNDLVAGIAFPETRAGTSGPSGTCPGSVQLTLAAGGGAPCQRDTDCIPGTCINGTCTTPTDIDLGWSGIAHDQDVPDKDRIALGLSCTAGQAPCGSCTVTGIDPGEGHCRCSNDSTIECALPFATDPACGGATCVCYAGEPTPMIDAGIPLCYVPLLSGQPAGSIDVDTGDAALSLSVLAQLYLGNSLVQPCPVCAGDVVPGDGLADGSCTDGPRAGMPCDAAATDYTFGAVSLDCLPSPSNNVSGSGLRTALDLSTGTSTLASSIPCLSASGTCPCGSCSLDQTIACSSDADCGAAGPCQAAMTQPNACLDLVCTAGTDGDGTCDNGPTDKFCDGFVRANGSGIIGCSTNADCSAAASSCPGGDCGACTLARLRECFPSPISAAGLASPGYPVLAGATCVPAAGSGWVNNSIGLVGPERVILQTRARFFCASDPAKTYEPGTGGCP